MYFIDIALIRKEIESKMDYSMAKSIKPYMDELERKLVDKMEHDRMEQCTWLKYGDYVVMECSGSPRLPYRRGYDSYKYCPNCGLKFSMYDLDEDMLFGGFKNHISKEVLKTIEDYRELGGKK